jgi:hypothetical protein
VQFQSPENRRLKLVLKYRAALGANALGEVLQPMTDTDAAKKVELAQKHINYQRQRIAHQKEMITQLKRDHKTELLPAAHALLKDLEHVLAGMMAEQRRAQQRT